MHSLLIFLFLCSFNIVPRIKIYIEIKRIEVGVNIKFVRSAINIFLIV